MKSIGMLALALFAVLSSPLHALCEDVAHFNKLDIPASEARLSELARVREFRCSYELPQFSQATLLIAEYYKDGKRVKVFPLAHAKYDTRLKKTTGIISIGWHRDLHNLISVHDNGDMYTPWTASISLPDFTPADLCYFKDSSPEARKPESESGMDFTLYPVMGICGQREKKISYQDVKDKDSFLSACTQAGAKDMVLIYLYMSANDDHPSMPFTDPLPQ